eukprot:CAMPEP_0173386238 /NCGR_PEP_ID=MMETSP1356-20130122/8838_1 /TAXON_ID=77927 ORGANISM="Hemiselmis virescens, Strain PCC157" /NCGR_SAMPLE_ID=MMETSP1356 /ASSEMBLY_ACC=CAM_ASM_000847 /LENGTH=55 /DNA_ID=CAMNT_0014342395 /DNA_START=398 /DNA_END=565 /DNA_ORIENTATION=+
MTGAPAWRAASLKQVPAGTVTLLAQGVNVTLTWTLSPEKSSSSSLAKSLSFFQAL